MATADPSRSRTPRVVGVASVLLMLVFGAAVVAIRRESSTPATSTRAERVTSDARHRFDGLVGLLAASDLVVVGRVVADEPGRVFGSGGGTGEDGSRSTVAVRSHVLTVRVDRVLASSHGADSAPSPDTVVLVEEEHSLVDGTPVVVDGMRPGRVGDRGIWFLAAGGDPELPTFAVVNSQGRFVFSGPDAIEGGDGTDRLVRRLEALGRGGLEAAIIGAAGG